MKSIIFYQICLCVSLCVCSSLFSSMFFQEGAVLVDLVSVILKGQQQNDEFSKKERKKERKRQLLKGYLYSRVVP